jgi:hypothetical protein
MSNATLVNHSELYSGQYVAVKSFSDQDVISHGVMPMDVIKEAKEKGCPDPVLIFVPENGMLNFY